MTGIKWLTSHKIEQGTVLINKYGAIRFKSEFATLMKFEKDERWRIGVYRSEAPAKHVLLVRATEENRHEGFKMQYQNKSWFVTCKTLLKELGIELPCKCKMAEFKEDGLTGIKIILPSN